MVEAARAQAANAPAVIPSGASPGRTQNVTINLINRLVQRGILTEEDAAELVRMAEEDAAAARDQAAAVQATAQQVQVVAAHMAQQVPQQDVPWPPMTDGDIQVTYIPDAVREQIREEIKRDLMLAARDGTWKVGREQPDWVSRVRLFGDVRVRYEGILFNDGNDNTGAFPNFNAINTGSPFDISGNQFAPQLNVDQDRDRVRLRLRFGAEATLGNGFSMGLRLATGESNSPTTTNQSLGRAGTGQGGNFSKYAIWLDRGFLKWEVGSTKTGYLSASFGRFDSPFFSTEIMWDDDVGFDGFALTGKYEVVKGFVPFFAAGVFPVFNTDFNYSSLQPAKFESEDKWLYAAQIGFELTPMEKVKFKLAAAYYSFDNIEGRLSDPFVPLSSSDAGNTDATRPAFAQKGNTYMALRNIIPTIDNDFGTRFQFQYYGLATPFDVLALTGRVDIDSFEPVRISLYGEYVQNQEFDQAAIERIAVNNRGSSSDLSIGRFDGGDTGYILGIRVGSVALEKALDWQINVNYRYVESDAVVDGFTESTFGLGGTNLKGFSIGGLIALGPQVYLGVRWMSSDEIAGPPLRNDIFQIDIGGKF